MLGWQMGARHELGNKHPPPGTQNSLDLPDDSTEWVLSSPQYSQKTKMGKWRGSSKVPGWEAAYILALACRCLPASSILLPHLEEAAMRVPNELLEN